MITAAYFRDRLARDVAAVGETAFVEVRLRNGDFHRVHRVLAVEEGYVSLEAYELRGNEAGWKEDWQEQVLDAKAAGEVSRAVVPYESIVDVVLRPGRAGASPRIGFDAQRYGDARAADR